VNSGPVKEVSVLKKSPSNYVESGITYTISTPQSTKLFSETSAKPEKFVPWTPAWLDQRLRQEDIPKAVGYL
jgi:hypothetical protein